MSFINGCQHPIFQSDEELIRARSVISVEENSKRELLEKEKSINEKNERIAKIRKGELTYHEKVILIHVTRACHILGVEIRNYDDACNYLLHLYNFDLYEPRYQYLINTEEAIVFRDTYYTDEEYVFHLAYAASDIFYNANDLDMKGIMNSQYELNRLETELNKFGLSFFASFPHARNIYDDSGQGGFGRPIIR